MCVFPANTLINVCQVIPDTVQQNLPEQMAVAEYFH